MGTFTHTNIIDVKKVDKLYHIPSNQYESDFTMTNKSMTHI